MNETEFTEFVASTKAVVLAAIRRHLNPALLHSIDDVAQESYLRAYRYLLKYGSGALRPERAGSWIYTIARNECRRMNAGHGRESGRLRLFTERLASQAERTSDQIPDDVDESIQELAGTDAELRQILRMRADGFRVREIAACLNMPEGTIKSRLARLRQRVRAATGKAEGESLS